jgi:hypothetical protein
MACFSYLSDNNGFLFGAWGKCLDLYYYFLRLKYLEGIGSEKSILSIWDNCSI